MIYIDTLGSPLLKGKAIVLDFEGLTYAVVN